MLTGGLGLSVASRLPATQKLTSLRVITNDLPDLPHTN